jgi:hypothetical protein
MSDISAPNSIDADSALLDSDKKVVDFSNEQNLRRSIISINNDSSLTPAQKAKMIQVKPN